MPFVADFCGLKCCFWLYQIGLGLVSELKENKSAVEDQGIRIRLESEALSRLRVKGAIGGKSEQVVRTKCFSWHSYALGHRLSCLWSHALSYAAQCASYCAHCTKCHVALG